LSRPVCCDPEEVEALAREIADPNANGKILELASRIAEAALVSAD
jgi:hypothetical protein